QRCNFIGPAGPLPNLYYPRCVEAAEHDESRRLAGKAGVERYRHAGSTGNLIHSIARSAKNDVDIHAKAFGRAGKMVPRECGGENAGTIGSPRRRGVAWQTPSNLYSSCGHG